MYRQRVLYLFFNRTQKSTVLSELTNNDFSNFQVTKNRTRKVDVPHV